MNFLNIWSRISVMILRETFFFFNLALLKLPFSFPDAELMTLEDYVFITKLKSGMVSKKTHAFMHRQLQCLWHKSFPGCQWTQGTANLWEETKKRAKPKDLGRLFRCWITWLFTRVWKSLDTGIELLKLKSNFYLLLSCVTLGNFLNLSVLQFLFPKTEVMRIPISENGQDWIK